MIALFHQSSSPMPFRLSSSPLLALALALMASLVPAAPATAQAASSIHAARPSLITEPIDESRRTVLSGNLHPLATRANDRGPVDPSMPAARMLLLLKRNSQQETALRATIESLHDRNSPNFHKWLTPAQFGAEWGATDSDIAALTAWLESHGFSVAGPSTGRTAIEFSGTAGQIQEAFQTAIHSYVVDGVTHHANASEPQIPAALAPIVAGISTLNDFRPHSLTRKGPRGIYNIKTHRAHPDLTAKGSDFYYLYVGPADAAVIYDTPVKALNPAFTGSNVDGSGAIIGIIGDSNIDASQNANYRTLFGLATKAPKVILDGGTDPGENGDVVEAYLDTQVSNGLAPGAKVYFYTAADTNVDYGLDLAILRAVNDNVADVLSLSFGLCEAFLGTSGNEYYESVWQQAAAQGMSVTVSSGDNGSAGCDDDNTQSTAMYGLQVNGLASTPYNVAVGGTDFAALVTNFTDYVSTASDPATLGSAKSYIPEVPWNDSNYTFPPLGLSTDTPNPPPYGDIVAGSGGKSNCADSGVSSNGSPQCSAGYSKPSWQSAPGVTADKARDLPDVSLFAANGYYYGSWGICTDQDSDPDGNPVEDCTPGSNGLKPDEFYIYGVGGTSASAPAMAGILALVRQSTGERQGQADYVLYNLARNLPASFHDITTGNNSVACTGGTPNCGSNGFLTGYDAGAGYDLASGLGSVDAAAVIANWQSAGLTSSATTLSLTPTSIQHGQAVTADVSVSGSPTATGDVALVAEANALAFPLSKSIGIYDLKSGGTTGNFSINSLPGGQYSVVATYGGSATLTQSVSAPVSVTVTAEPSTTLVEAQAYDPASGNPAVANNYPYGWPLYFTAQPYGNHSPIVNGAVQPDGIATGSVAFMADAFSDGSGVLGISGIALSRDTMLTAGAHKIEGVYHGDLSFEPSTGIRAIDVAKASTKLSMTASGTSYTEEPITFKVTMQTVSVGLAPTGSVELKGGGIVLAKVALAGVAGLYSSSTYDYATGSATLTISVVPPGNTAVTAVYVGDNNYAPSTSNAVNVDGKPTFVMGNISIHLPVEHTTRIGFIPVRSEGGYAGTVNLSCQLVSQSTSVKPAECAMYPATAMLTANSTTKAGILIFGQGTKLPSGVTLGGTTTSSVNSWEEWIGASGAVLAFCVLFGIPAKRRAWRAMLSAILLLAALGGFAACVATPKLITPGDYTFRVTGVDSKDATNTATSTVTVTVN
jgi:trimeric autotransporter adhesin